MKTIKYRNKKRSKKFRYKRNTRKNKKTRNYSAGKGKTKAQLDAIDRENELENQLERLNQHKENLENEVIKLTTERINSENVNKNTESKWDSLSVKRLNMTPRKLKDFKVPYGKKSGDKIDFIFPSGEVKKITIPPSEMITKEGLFKKIITLPVTEEQEEQIKKIDKLIEEQQEMRKMTMINLETAKKAEKKGKIKLKKLQTKIIDTQLKKADATRERQRLNP